MASMLRLLEHYNFAKAQSLLGVLSGERQSGIYFVSSMKPLSENPSPPYVIQNLTAVPTSPSDLIMWWVQEFENQAAQEHFWEPRTTRMLVLRLRTTIAVLADGLAGREAIAGQLDRLDKVAVRKQESASRLGGPRAKG